MSLKVDPIYIPREVLVTKRRADTTKLNNYIKHEFKVPLKKGLTELVDHIKTNFDQY